MNFPQRTNKTAKFYSKKKLIIAISASIVGTLLAVFVALYLLVGAHGLSLLVALGIVNTQFVGDYDLAEVTDAALDGMVNGLGDRWSYYVDEESYEAQILNRANQYVGIGVTVSY